MIRVISYFAGMIVLSVLTACGTRVPLVQEPWEDESIGRSLPNDIKKNILCELVTSIQLVNSVPYYEGLRPKKPLPDNYGVQFQLNLMYDEKTAVVPGLTYTRTLLDGMVHGKAVGRSVSLAIGGNVSSTATSTRTMYDYYNVGRISDNDPKKLCNEKGLQQGSSPLLMSDLGIRDFLIASTRSAILFPSSANRKDGGETKRGIFTYSTKFVIETTGNITPSFKLVALSGDGSPFLSSGRTRTHELILTFSPDSKSSEGEPSAVAIQSHFTTQLIQTLNQINSRQ